MGDREDVAEIQHEYVVVAIRHDGTIKPLVIHEDLGDARTAALRAKGGIVSVPTDGIWDVLRVEHGYRSLLIYKVGRIPRGVSDPKVGIR